jgi:hypothetical protein
MEIVVGLILAGLVFCLYVLVLSKRAENAGLLEARKRREK